MTARRLLAVAGVAATVAGAVLAGAQRDGSPREPARPRVIGPRRPPAAGRASVARAAALAVARRFASAYAQWDAGVRDSATGRRLAATATGAVLAELGRRELRPVAHGVQPLELTVAVAQRVADGYAVALGQPRRPGSQVVTVVVVPTADGPRVGRLER
jgi:hypothetical protein